MRYVIVADDDLPVVASVEAALAKRGHEVRRLPTSVWAAGALEVARAVSEGKADAGVVLCFTGTGVSIAANKVRGVRAALCVDAETARGARRYNDANVLALSLRLLTPTLAEEIVGAWLDTPYQGEEKESLEAIERAER